MIRLVEMLIAIVIVVVADVTVGVIIVISVVISVSIVGVTAIIISVGCRRLFPLQDKREPPHHVLRAKKNTCSNAQYKRRQRLRSKETMIRFKKRNNDTKKKCNLLRKNRRNAIFPLPNSSSSRAWFRSNVPLQVPSSSNKGMLRSKPPLLLSCS